MDKLKKSGENVTNFIIDSLKGNTVSEYVNGELPIMPEMRNLSPSTKPTDFVENETQNEFARTLLKAVGFLLLIFVIYKFLQTYPDIMTKLKSIFGIVETEIKKIKNIIANPMFDSSNNLNSNEILDFLLGTKKQTPDEWCFVGESNEKRVCTLTQGNQCMSGNIFPSQNLCVNPKLKG